MFWGGAEEVTGRIQALYKKETLTSLGRVSVFFIARR